MAVASPASLTSVSRRVLRLHVFTILWMTLEAVISLVSAWNSRSTALLTFGGDSLVELLSSAVVFWRFRFAFDEARAGRIAGALLYALSGLVALASVLNFVGYRETRESLVGMAGRRSRDALARQPETAIGSRHVERRPQGRCCEVSRLRLYGLDCPFWLGGERSLAQAVGRPRGRPGAHSPHSVRGMAGHARVSARMRLLSESRIDSAFLAYN